MAGAALKARLTQQMMRAGENGLTELGACNAARFKMHLGRPICDWRHRSACLSPEASISAEDQSGDVGVQWPLQPELERLLQASCPLVHKSPFHPC